MSKKDLKKIFIKSSPFPFDHSKLKEIDTVSVLANINTNDDLRKLELFFKNFNKNYPKTNFNNYLYFSDNEMPISVDNFIILNDYIKNKKSKSIKKSINLIINNEKINSDLLIYFNPYYFSPINYLLKYIHTESCIGIGNEEYQNYFQLYFIINEDQEIDTIFDTLNKFK
ncbi:MAG: hypothetical protein BWX61_01379 [Bacteroidetes bacterium ADurb.Bin035]|nr:hypothetical protein [Bacteroidales bacterium]OQC42304.1 MAG: hypothetical protein BWX61_01379 [Bacteroidetes bacterium ADurb.Bin035]MBP8947125.1 hypothetical protein [Bacteroidales bacterium]HNQ19627.1 hypothetical protein [Bacteroidales bacterium]HOC40914.1 hypothetical protein [Bacteroidales bacterium]